MGLFNVLNEAMQWEAEKRPCEMYCKIICTKCASPKSCNDLDVIMCGVGKLLEDGVKKTGAEQPDQKCPFYGLTNYKEMWYYYVDNE